MTWTANDSTDTDLESTTPPSRLFIMLTDGVESFKGAEFDITWAPPGDGGACFPGPSMVVPGAADCSYLNRGTAVPIVTINQPGHMHAAWANTASNQSCSAGTIVELDMDFSGCTDTGRTFTLNSLIVLDSLNGIHTVGGLGTPATVSGGQGNRPPAIKPIPDFSYTAGVALTLPIKGGDPDGDPLTFSLTSIDPAPSGPPPVVTTDTPTTGTLTWTPALADVGVDFTTVVQADDGRGGVGRDTFVVSVVTDRPPRIRHIDDTSVAEQQLLSILVSGVDPDGDPMTFSLGGIDPLPPSGVLPAVRDSTSTLGVMTWTPSAGDAGAYRIGLLADDGRGGVGTELFRVSVLPPNNPPMIQQQPDTTIAEAVTSLITLHASDPDSLNTKHLIWSLRPPAPPWASLSPTKGGTVVLTCMPGLQSADSLGSGGVGKDIITVIVSDRRRGQHGLLDTMQFVLTISDVNINRPPAFEPVPPSVVSGGKTLARPVSASDPDLDPIQFSFSSITPPPPSGTLPTVSTDSPTTGTITWTPSVADTGATYAIDVLASDGRGGQTTGTASVTVVSNLPPTIDLLSYHAIDAGATLVVLLSGSDPDGDPLHFSLDSMIPPPPSGVLPAVADSGTSAGLLTWTPQLADQGLVSTVTVRVQDTHGASATTSFVVQVLSPPANQAAYAQLSWSATDPTQTDLPVPGAIADLFIDLPSGVTSYKGAEFDITWSPAGDGVKCRTQLGPSFPTSSGTTCTYLNRGSAVPIVTADESNHLHVAWANTITNTSCTSGSIVRIGFEFDGCIDPTTTFTLNSLILLDENNATWSLAADHLGTPATVGGGGGSNSPPTIDAVSGRSMTQGATLVAALAGHDADGDSLHFSLASIVPPPPSGIVPTVADSGVTYATLRWGPGAADVGLTYTVTVQVQDPQGAAASTAFPVTVTPGNLHAQLSWSPTDFALTDLATPGALNNLYIDMTSGVQSFKGAEFDITWTPPGNGIDCRAHIGTLYRTSSGTTCTYLNRGSAVPIVLADEPGHLHIAWANNTVNTSCTAGAIIQLQFEFDGAECADPRTTFTLGSLLTLDASNNVVEVLPENLGTPATVLGGAAAGISKGGRGSLPSVNASITTGLHVTPTIVASSAQVAYAVHEDASVDVGVFASDGRRLRTLAAGFRNAGEYGVAWDGRDDGGVPLARGVYYVRALLGERRFAERIVLLR